ncbi:MAG: glycosyltransferase family 4 protein [Nitrospirota bacterium]
MKIALIGPTYPFRGGIAHHTTLLCRALRKKHEVKFISFKRQYPKILFPGKSDRDPSKKPVTIDNVDYLLDSLNPFSWIKVYRAIKEFKPEKVVVPWWVASWMPQFWTITSLIKRNLEAEVVFICHNAVEHESNGLKRRATKAVLSRAMRIITQSKEDTENLKDLFGDEIKCITAFHPTYSELANTKYSKDYAKKILGLRGDVLLFFGFIRDYKGLDVLLKAMPMVIKEKREATLLVVGEFWNDKKKYMNIINDNRTAGNITIIDEYIPNEGIGKYFAAADLVVQPYISASGSGICQIAYGFDRPVIATNVGSLPDVVQDGINGRIVKPRDHHGLAEAILESLEKDTLDTLTRNAEKTKERFSWERMADIVTGVSAENKNDQAELSAGSSHENIQIPGYPAATS